MSTRGEHRRSTWFQKNQARWPASAIGVFLNHYYLPNHKWSDTIVYFWNDSIWHHKNVSWTTGLYSVAQVSPS
jgi:hypothetical protein